MANSNPYKIMKWIISVNPSDSGTIIPKSIHRTILFCHFLQTRKRFSARIAYGI
jgi:hypothetical protein